MTVTAQAVEQMIRAQLRAYALGYALDPADDVGGYGKVVVPLTSATPIEHNVPCYGYFFPQAGNPSGARLVATYPGSGPQVDVIVPGALSFLATRKLRFTREASSVQTGNAVIYTFENPRALLYMPDAPGQATIQQGAAAPAGDAQAAAVATPEGANFPVGTPGVQGIDTRSLSSFFGIIDAGLGNTLTSGEWWIARYDPVSQLWSLRSGLGGPLQGGTRTESTPEIPVGVGTGIQSLILTNYVASGGTPTVYYRGA